VAAARVAASDAARASYHRRHFGARWNDESLYDVILNMSRLTVPMAIDIVCASADALMLNAAETNLEGCES
jgi:hypothetical protein